MASSDAGNHGGGVRETVPDAAYSARFPPRLIVTRIKTARGVVTSDMVRAEVPKSLRAVFCQRSFHDRNCQ